MSAYANDSLGKGLTRCSANSSVGETHSDVYSASTLLSRACLGLLFLLLAVTRNVYGDQLCHREGK